MARGAGRKSLGKLVAQAGISDVIRSTTDSSVGYPSDFNVKKHSENA